MFKQESDARVAVFVAPGLEEIEGLTVVDLLFRAGVPCDTVAITPERQVTSSHEVTIVCDRSICEPGFSFDDYGMLVLPGGIPGTPNLRACAPLCDAVSAFAAAGRPVAAICAAPSILSGLGMLRGRKACAYPSFEAELDCGEVQSQPVVTDGHITTGRGMGAAIPFALRLTALLEGDEKAEEIRESIVYEA